MPNIVPLDMPAAYWREKAQRARRAGNAVEAVRLYRAALRKYDDSQTRRELAETYADMRALSVSDRLYVENLARDASDADSLYGLARNRSLAGDQRTMADLLDLYLRIAPCGPLSDQARDILWRMPREPMQPRRMRRAQVLCDQAMDHANDWQAALKIARHSWKRGKTAECAQLLCELYHRAGKTEKALAYACAACDMKPEGLEMRLQLAQALYLNDMPEACRAALKSAQRLCLHADQQALYCQYAIGMGYAELAVELMEPRVSKYPNSTDALLLLALALQANRQDEARVRELLRRVAMLDEDDLLPRALLDVPWDGSENDEDASRRIQMKISEIFLERLENETDIHRGLVQMMRLPMPGLFGLAVQTFIQRGDALGLRLVLIEHEMAPMQYAAILHALEEMGSPMPCFARVRGRLCLLPQKIKPPYDADLHELIRRQIHLLRGRVPLGVVVREMPSAWRRLPESARKHCAQARDDVWMTAFAAYLLMKSGREETAHAYIRRSRRPMRVQRAYMQLIRRSNTIHEVY